jgi:hypothetical protein
MELLRTSFRVAVMLAAVVIGYHGWQLYGPSVDRLRLLALRIIEIAQSALGAADQADNAKQLQATASPASPPLALPVADQNLQSQSLVSASEAPRAHGEPAVLAPPALATLPPEASVAPADAEAPEVPEAELLALYSRLEGLGIVEPRLATWGNDGQLYRFSCRVAVDGTAGLQRNFEAVAAEPGLAVEQVVAKVEAWRAAQRETAHLGTVSRF